MRLIRWVAVGVVVVAAGGCFPGDGSGLTGRSGENGGGTGSAPRTLAFTVQPSDANVDEIITPAIQVAARDSTGSTDVTFSGTVTVAFGANQFGAFLEGTRSVVAVSGVASFGDLSVDRAGSGFTLVASATGATAATSAAFNIVTPP